MLLPRGQWGLAAGVVPEVVRRPITLLALVAAAILTLVIPRLCPIEPGHSSGLRRGVV